MTIGRHRLRVCGSFNGAKQPLRPAGCWLMPTIEVKSAAGALTGAIWTRPIR